MGLFRKINILGVSIADTTVNETANIIIRRIHENRPTAVYTPNSEIIENFRKDKEKMELLNSADILTADGSGVVLASQILGHPLRERCAGFDVACELLKRAVDEELTFYLFGSKEEIVIKAKENILKKYPGIQIVGTHNGFFSDDEDVGSLIAKEEPDVVFVCLGAYKQEKWIYDNKSKFKKAALMGLGGSLDVFAGAVKRAPKIFIKLNLEWLYRLIKQPSRFVRMLALPKFIFAVIKERLKKRKES